MVSIIMHIRREKGREREKKRERERYIWQTETSRVGANASIHWWNFFLFRETYFDVKDFSSDWIISFT